MWWPSLSGFERIREASLRENGVAKLLNSGLPAENAPSSKHKVPYLNYRICSLRSKMERVHMINVSWLALKFWS